MIDDVFVLDGALHVMDWSPAHMKEDLAITDPATLQEMIKIGKRMTGASFELPAGSLDIPQNMSGNHAAAYRTMFEEAPTDMAVVGSLPFGPGTQSDLYRDPEYFIKLNHGFAAAHPDRCIFSGGIEPSAGDMKYSLDMIEWQAYELGAKLMKFYPFTWSPDDERVAYPLYEKCREVGIDTIQYHLALPADQSHDVERQRPNALQRVARDFPDMNVVMHHPMPLYFEETANIAMRFPNIYLLISPMVQMSLIQPRLVQKMLGQLLQQVGSDRLMYGSEGSISGNPTPFMRAVLDFDIPEDLQVGYGYPQITRKDKENILGLTFARLLGIDVEAKKMELNTPSTGARA